MYLFLPPLKKDGEEEKLCESEKSDISEVGEKLSLFIIYIYIYIYNLFNLYKKHIKQFYIFLKNPIFIDNISPLYLFYNVF